MIRMSQEGIIEKFVSEVDFAKGDGLVPVIVQDEKTKDILMLAYANREALELSTMHTGQSRAE